MFYDSLECGAYHFICMPQKPQTTNYFHFCSGEPGAWRWGPSASPADPQHQKKKGRVAWSNAVTHVALGARRSERMLPQRGGMRWPCLVLFLRFARVCFGLINQISASGGKEERKTERGRVCVCVCVWGGDRVCVCIFITTFRHWLCRCEIPILVFHDCA